MCAFTASFLHEERVMAPITSTSFHTVCADVERLCVAYNAIIDVVVAATKLAVWQPLDHLGILNVHQNFNTQVFLLFTSTRKAAATAGNHCLWAQQHASAIEPPQQGYIINFL